MPQPLTETTINIVTATVPALEAHGEAIVARMYERLLADPDIRSFFNMSHQSGNAPQHKALAGAILAYAKNIRDPLVLATAIERIAHKHVALQIKPDHYGAVATALLGAIQDVLGDAATDDILDAWGKAYWFLAEVLIDREASLYHDQEQTEGGWSGWRRFVVAERWPETADITSFVLRPEDGGPVPRHKPGQYLTLLADPGTGQAARRTYSISSAPNGRDYRITVKREPGGRVSGWLHDHVEPGAVLEVGAPMGDFFLDPAEKDEIVLLSGGVGLTPMMAMLEAHADQGLPITFVHAARSGTHHAMKEPVRRLAAKSAVFYDTPANTDIAGRDFDQKGRVSAEWLAAHTNPARSDYFICGPVGFMRAAIADLRRIGVPETRLHYEFFGPASEVL